MHYTKLLEPFSIGNMHLKNRVVMGPMATQFADEKHRPTEALINHYAARAKGGAGMIICEHTITTVAGSYGHHTLWAFPESCVPYWKKMIDEVHKYGTKFVAQLGNTGNSCSSEFSGVPTVSASAIPEPLYQTVPHEMTIEEIQQFKREYLQCVKNMYNAGADAVLLHLANGYFFGSWISGRTNKRTDEYGGTLEGRLRLPLEIIRLIREEIGAHYPIFARMAAHEENSGRSLEESKVVARALQDAGVSAISVNSGSFYEFDYEIPSYYQDPAYNIRAAEQIKRSLTIPVFAGGRITEPRMAEQILQEGRVDLIEINRAFLTEPNWVNKVSAGEIDTIRRCIGCTRCCIDLQWGGKATCSINPFLGRDDEADIKPAANKKKVVVIGGGPVGLEAAMIAARRGHDVSLLEKTHNLGGLARVADVPPKKYEIGGWITSMTAEAKKAGVKILLDTEGTAALIKDMAPDEVIVATGSKPLLPSIPGINEDNVDTAVNQLSGKQLPGKKVAIIGGNDVGLETAEYLIQFGRQITIFEMLPTIGDGLYWGIGPNLMGKLAKAGVVLTPGAKVLGIQDGVITYEKDGKKCESDRFDDILLAVGMESENAIVDELQKAGFTPIVIGDAKKP